MSMASVLKNPIVVAVALIVYGLIVYAQDIPIYFAVAFPLLLFGAYKLIEFLIQSVGRDEPMKKAFEFANNWWMKEMKMGEFLDPEFTVGAQGYLGKERVFGFLVTRRGKKHRRLLIIVGTMPYRIIMFDESPPRDIDHPFDVFPEKYQPTPYPVDLSVLEKEKLKELLYKRPPKKPIEPGKIGGDEG